VLKIVLCLGAEATGRGLALNLVVNENAGLGVVISFDVESLASHDHGGEILAVFQNGE
jgi:hypothetical protein